MGNTMGTAFGAHFTPIGWNQPTLSRMNDIGPNLPFNLKKNTNTYNNNERPSYCKSKEFFVFFISFLCTLQTSAE